MDSTYPLRLSPSFHSTIWAGQRLVREGWKRPSPSDPNTSIGESWETDESNVILNGQFAGMRVGDLAQNLGTPFLGEAAVRLFGNRFPLLVKFADMAGSVSIHVHPDDDYALSSEGNTWGKPEFFYVLDAAPHSTITHGFNTFTTRDAVQAAIEAGTLETMLHRIEVRTGDAVFVAPGAIHSVGAGVLLYEVQAYSNVTYRLFDYGRRFPSSLPRPLSVNKGLDVLNYGPSDRTVCVPKMVASTDTYDDVVLIACKQFMTRRLDIRSAINGGKLFTTQSSCFIVSSVGGKVVIRYGIALSAMDSISKGETLVLPSNLGQFAFEGVGTLLVSYVPEHDDPAASLWWKANGISASA